MAFPTENKLLEHFDYYLIQMENQLPDRENVGTMSKKVEQIIRMDRFRLKHYRWFRQLTDREVEVLTLLANGCNNPQIADQLFISRQTVETHRKKINRKLGIRSLRDLMRYAFAFDLVEC